MYIALDKISILFNFKIIKVYSVCVFCLIYFFRQVSKHLNTNVNFAFFIEKKKCQKYYTVSKNTTLEKNTSGLTTVSNIA
jgi:hypothetical protein